MKFQINLTVLGMKSSKGEMDNGVRYDSTKVYVLTELDSSKGNTLGSAITDYTIGDSTMMEAFRSQKFPFQATADCEMVSNGKASKLVIHKLVPAPGRASA